MGLVIERWRAVVGLEGKYEVSDLGCLRSLDCLVSIGRGYYRLKKGMPIKLRPTTKSGHLSAFLRGREGSALVHVMVLTAFVGPAPIGMEACHNDGDPTNNALRNLRWDTRGNNMRDIKHHKRRTANMTLWPADVLLIRELIAQGVMQKKIAEQFGVTPALISYIKQRKIHTDV